MTFTLPALPYAYDALGAHMSAETLEFHHDKHHQAYVDNGNKLLAGTEFEGQSLEDIVKNSHGKNAGLFNNAAQHYNHLHFWNWMGQAGTSGVGGTNLPASVQTLVDRDLGGFNQMRQDFITAGTTQFGSGWAWLALKNDKLEIMKTPNGENPLIHGATPILGCDVWEHSYYIDYRNARPKYLESWFDNLINWSYVEECLHNAQK